MGLWDVKRDDERDNWVLDALVTVGPLWFGMSLDEVIAALGSRPGASSSGTLGVGVLSYPHMTAYFRAAILYCVAIDALIGPQVTVDGVKLVGRVPSEVEHWALEYVERHDVELAYSPGADPHLVDLGLVVRAQRAGDVVLTRPLFLGERVDDVWHYVPIEEWHPYG
ncbi:hypothetical protein Daura_43565 [Dactylosporangium aurantiacum]|uniref:Uncharacterized protein n=1 Tax=Dactylosporangium aurantiacum TaxID=35754 RepID=A0A9Q9IDK3_9ACTN|nr:hypothetical protein [Dactylosporangium aurantiacum]MDG6102340.1 hypothetical protein [Dactylosporangium aurantiacum]UWZ53361.1 hypothetical protein Daura_43565 [Dactylosporangium aurantiacum]